MKNGHEKKPNISIHTHTHATLTFSYKWGGGGGWLVVSQPAVVQHIHTLQQQHLQTELRVKVSEKKQNAAIRRQMVRHSKRLDSSGGSGARGCQLRVPGTGSAGQKWLGWHAGGGVRPGAVKRQRQRPKGPGRDERTAVQ